MQRVLHSYLLIRNGFYFHWRSHFTTSKTNVCRKQVDVAVVDLLIPYHSQLKFTQRCLTMEDLSSDLVVKILTYLSASDLCRSQRACKRFHTAKVDSYLWDSVLMSAAVPSLLESFTNTLCAWDVHEYSRKYNAARQLEAMSTLDRVCWSPLNYSNSALTGGPRLEKMEAHTMTLLLNRFAVIVGGWSDSSDNRIEVVDCGVLHLAGHSEQCLSTLNTFTERTPRFRYGFSTVEHKGRLIVYGGCRGGGYSHDCNDCYSVDLCFEINDAQSGADLWYYANTELSPAHSSVGDDDDDMQGYGNTHRLRQATTGAYYANHSNDSDENHDNNSNNGNTHMRWDSHWEEILSAAPGDIHQVVAQYSENLTLPAMQQAMLDTQGAYVPITRAYHSAVVVRLNGTDCMLVWGGLHRRAPTSQLELLDLQTMLWRRGAATGQEPSPRFGHSCVLMPGSDGCKKDAGAPAAGDRLVFTGGSDGNDLVRNGTEIREIHVLHIVRPACQTAGVKGEPAGDALVWSTPLLNAVPLHLRFAQAVPGRCHCAVRVGERVLYFGGGAESTNTVQVLHAPCTGGGGPGGEYSLYLPTVAAVRGTGAGTSTGQQQKQQQVRHYPAPRGRCSSSAVLSGRYVLVFGGFSVEHREMGDTWLLDLAYGTSDQYCLLDRAAAAARTTVTGGLFGGWGQSSGSAAEEYSMDEEGEDHQEQQDHGFHAHHIINKFMLAGLLQQQPGAGLEWLNSLTAGEAVVAGAEEGEPMDESAGSDSENSGSEFSEESGAGLDSSSGDHATSDSDGEGGGDGDGDV